MTTGELTMQFNKHFINFSDLHHVMNRHPLTIAPHNSINDAISMMYKTSSKNLSVTNVNTACNPQHHDLITNNCVLVVDAQQILGIFTAQDIARLAASNIDFSQVTIAEVMTQPVTTIKLSELQNFLRVLSVLHQYRFDQLPIVDEKDSLVGSVAPARLLPGYRHLTALNLPSQPEQLPQKIDREITKHQQIATAWPESEDKLRCFAENIPALIWIAESNSGEILYINPAYEKIWGRSCQSLREQPTSWLESVHPDDRDRLIAKIEQQKQSSLALANDEEYRILQPDGSVRWIWHRGLPIRNQQGQIYAYGGIAEDITERKQIEASLRESEARLNLVLASQHMGIFDWNLLTNHILWSENMVLLYGLPLGTTSPSPEAFLNLVHPEDRTSFVEAMSFSIEQQQELAIAYRVVWPDGSIHWLSTQAQIYYNQDGQPIRMLGTTKDISNHKQAEQIICEQATLLDKATDAIIVKDLKSEILYWNQGAERLYGWSHPEVFGKISLNLLDPEPLSQLYQTALKTVMTTGAWQGELPKTTKSGTSLMVESRWTLMRDTDGTPKAILIVETDITQKKQLEEQFFRTQRLENLGKLAGGIAHDLNNILTPILAAAQLLKAKNTAKLERSQQLLEIIENNAKRGAGLVRQVLSFARGYQDGNTIVQVKHLIRDIMLIGKQTFPKSIELHTKIAEDLWAVSGDATQLHQVLMNLVVNARDAMPEGGKISISAENIVIDETYSNMNIHAQVGRYLLVKIIDTGVGIPPTILDRIFEPFFTTKEIGTGTGLGLATVMGITKSHGGFVTVTSKVGEGSQFNLFLPAVQDLPDFITDDIAAPQGNGELILVVDDEVKICETINMTLEQHNYQVLTANNGIEAIAVYAQHKDQIKAIIMDMIMPEMDGITTIRTMQKMNPNVQIIACSGQDSPIDLASVTGIHVHHVLAKPFTAQELLHSLSELLQATGK